MSDSARPHRPQPTRLPHPWASPGRNTGVGCHFLLQCMKVESESEVTQSCPTLSNPHGLQATRLLRPWDFPGKSTGVGCHCLLQGSGHSCLNLTEPGNQSVNSKYFCEHPYYWVDKKEGFPGGTSGKEPPCQCRRHKRPGSIPLLGRSPEGGHDNPLQYSCLENPMDRGALQATVQEVPKSQM